MTRVRRYYEPSPAPRAAQPIPHGRPVEGHAPLTAWASRVRSISVYRHAVVNTPVARWALIARGADCPAVSLYPAAAAFPPSLHKVGDHIRLFGPAQRSLAVTACRLAESPIATRLSPKLRRFRFLPVRFVLLGWSDPVAGWELHPLKINTLHGSRRTQCLSVSPCPFLLSVSPWGARQINHHPGRVAPRFEPGHAPSPRGPEASRPRPTDVPSYRRRAVRSLAVTV